MSINQAVADSAASQLRAAWGGRLPTWDEYKAAVKAGTVQVNRTTALQMTSTAPVSPFARILCGIVLPWLAMLVVPASIVSALFGWSAWWWLFGAVLAAYALFEVARRGQCECLKVGAVRDEWFYRLMADKGALLFTPRQQQP